MEGVRNEEQKPEQQTSHLSGDNLEQAERQPEVVPRIYVASLADYGAGQLHGTWIEAAQDPEEIQDAIHGMLLASPMGVAAEEWAIHDFEGFNGMHLGEWEDLTHVSRTAKGIERHGIAFAHWAQIAGTGEELDKFEECYLGHWESVEDYAADLLEDAGLDQQIDAVVPEGLRPYVRIDAEAFGRDLQLGGDVTVTAAEEGGVHVFRTI